MDDLLYRLLFHHYRAIHTHKKKNNNLGQRATLVEICARFTDWCVSPTLYGDWLTQNSKNSILSLDLCIVFIKHD